jgi:alpha-tubulin suppressor-like RCC1 family protein
MSKPVLSTLFRNLFLLVLISALIAVPIARQPVAAETPPILPTSDVWGWGYNATYQLGDGTAINRSSPVQANNVTWAVAVAGGSLYSLVLKSDGTVWGWGYNASGQLGDGTTLNRNTPVQVSGLTDVKSISAGTLHNLALKNDGTVWSWGYNANGRLGDGTTVDRLTPVQIPGLNNVIAISAGGFQSLAVKADGTVWSWGYNKFGQLGDGTTVDRYNPVQVGGLTGVIAVASGGYHSLALKTDGTVWAWGYNNFGELGDNTSSNRSLPVQVTGLTGIMAIAAGGLHSLALATNQTIWAWGNNDNGRIGDGTTIDRITPVQVSGLNGVTAIGGGGCHSIALKADGTVWAWGYNNYGQLGDGTTTDRYTPVQVNGITGATAIGVNCYWHHNLVVVPVTKVGTNAAVNITAGGASLTGTLINLISGSTVSISFQWGTTSGVYNNETTPDNLSSIGTYSFDLGGLSPKTTYYFRAKAVGDGTVYGTEISFTTLAIPPTVATLIFGNVTAASATLNGQLVGIGSANIVTVCFEWGLTNSYGNSTTAQQMTSGGLLSADLGSLSPKTTYHFRIKAVGDGTVYGADAYFTTLAIPPSVTTDGTGNITPFTATINGQLTGIGSASVVTVSFEWGLTNGYGNTTSPQQLSAAGPVSAGLTLLTPKTSYHFRIVAVGDGTVYGNDAVFNSAPVDPTVSTDPNTTGISWNTATIHGSLDGLGTSSSVTVSFDWGTTTAYGNNTVAGIFIAPGSFNPMLLSELTPATTYHFRAKAVGDTTSYGLDQTFQTSVPTWDVNGDRKVNVNDVVSVGLHWNERGTPGWIPQDVNKDGIINVFDLVLLGLHWNESW